MDFKVRWYNFIVFEMFYWTCSHFTTCVYKAAGQAKLSIDVSLISKLCAVIYTKIFGGFAPKPPYGSLRSPAAADAVTQNHLFHFFFFFFTNSNLPNQNTVITLL